MTQSFGKAFAFMVFRLLAIGLGLPEETFVDMHGYDAVGETYGEPIFWFEFISARAHAYYHSPFHEIVRH